MTVGAIQGTQTVLSALQRVTEGARVDTQSEGQNFGQLISDAIQQLDQTQKQADAVSFQVASGESTDLAGALVKVEEANLALQLGLQVRNKVVESYQEIMRMQV